MIAGSKEEKKRKIQTQTCIVRKIKRISRIEIEEEEKKRS